jgi:hypothetical protein
MTTESQVHPLKDGNSVSISRDGRHQYWIGSDGPKMRSVTAMAKHIDGDGFSAGMGWALKEARNHDGDLGAPRRLSDESRQIGNALHSAIDNYISHGIVAEENPLFLAWFNSIGRDTEWLAAERFLYHPTSLYGGTVDAIGMTDTGEVVIFDWKTKGRESYERNGSYLSEHAQLGAYAQALQQMDSAYAPTRAKLAYIMRDGSYVDVVEIKINHASKIFDASMNLYRLLRQGGE